MLVYLFANLQPLVVLELHIEVEELERPDHVDGLKQLLVHRVQQTGDLHLVRKLVHFHAQIKTAKLLLLAVHEPFKNQQKKLGFL